MLGTFEVVFGEDLSQATSTLICSGFKGVAFVPVTSGIHITPVSAALESEKSFDSLQIFFSVCKCQLLESGADGQP